MKQGDPGLLLVWILVAGGGDGWGAGGGGRGAKLDEPLADLP